LVGFATLDRQARAKPPGRLDVTPVCEERPGITKVERKLQCASTQARRVGRAFFRRRDDRSRFRSGSSRCPPAARPSPAQSIKVVAFAPRNSAMVSILPGRPERTPPASVAAMREASAIRPAAGVRCQQKSTGVTPPNASGLPHSRVPRNLDGRSCKWRSHGRNWRDRPSATARST
jgi:hypothetical protein